MEEALFCDIAGAFRSHVRYGEFRIFQCSGTGEGEREQDCLFWKLHPAESDG